MKIKYKETMNNTLARSQHWHSRHKHALEHAYGTTRRTFFFFFNNFQMHVLITIPSFMHWTVSSQRDVLNPSPLALRNVTLFGYSVFTKGLKLKVIRWALMQYDKCPYKKWGKWTETQTHTGRTPCQDEGRDCNDAFPSQGMPRIASKSLFFPQDKQLVKNTLTNNKSKVLEFVTFPHGKVIYIKMK